MRFQVPQFVDIQDKIIGPLTVKQFGMYVVAIMIIIILYQIVDISLLITLSIPIVAVAALFAHVRFYGQPFAAVFFNGIGFYLAPKLYIWSRGKENVLHITGPEYEEYAAGGDFRGSALGVLAQSLTTEGNVVDQDVDDPILSESIGSDAKTHPPTDIESDRINTNNISTKPPKNNA